MKYFRHDDGDTNISRTKSKRVDYETNEYIYG